MCPCRTATSGWNHQDTKTQREPSVVRGRKTTAVRLSCGSGFLAAIKTESTIYLPHDMVELRSCHNET